MDSVILTLSVGLGIHKLIGVGRFVPVYLGVTNVLPILLTIFLHTDRVAEYNRHSNQEFSKRHHPVDEDFDFIIGKQKTVRFIPEIDICR